MRVLKSIALAALLTSSIIASAASAFAQEVVRIGTEGAYPPFNYFDTDGSLKGFDIDISNALCAEMGVTCEFVTQDWDGLIPGLLADRYDAIIASMSITPERLDVIDFTDKYYNSPPALAVANDSGITAGTAEGLSGSVIGAQSATVHETLATQLFTDSEVRGYPTPAEYQADLASGRIEAAFDDVVVLSEWLKSEEGACCTLLQTFDPPVEIYGPGIGIGIRKEDTDLRDRLNAAIQAIRANGVYKEINDRYFDFDVYGG